MRVCHVAGTLPDNVQHLFIPSAACLHQSMCAPHACLSCGSAGARLCLVPQLSISANIVLVPVCLLALNSPMRAPHAVHRANVILCWLRHILYALRVSGVVSCRRACEDVAAERSAVPLLPVPPPASQPLGRWRHVQLVSWWLPSGGVLRWVLGGRPLNPFLSHVHHP